MRARRGLVVVWVMVGAGCGDHHGRQEGHDGGPPAGICPADAEVNQCSRWNGVELYAADDDSNEAAGDDHDHDRRPDTDQIVAERCLCKDIAFKLPATMHPSRGSAVGGVAVLEFIPAGRERITTCVYRGRPGAGADDDDGDDDDGDDDDGQNGHGRDDDDRDQHGGRFGQGHDDDLDFHFSHCTDSTHVGTLRRSRYFRFSLDAAPAAGFTDVTLDLGERRFLPTDPALAGWELRVPMDAAAEGQQFTLVRDPMVLPGLFVRTGESPGAIAASDSVDVVASAHEGGLAFTPGTCAELDMRYDPAIFVVPDDPLRQAQAVRYEFSSRTPDADATVTPVEGVLVVDPSAAVATACVNHLSKFGLLLRDPSRTVGVEGMFRYQETETNPDTGSQDLRPIRHARVEVWTLRPGFLGIPGWFLDDVDATRDELQPRPQLPPGGMGSALAFLGSSVKYEVDVFAASCVADRCAHDIGAAGGPSLTAGTSREPFHLRTPEAQAQSASAPGVVLDLSRDVTSAGEAQFFNALETMQRGLEYVGEVRAPEDGGDVLPGLHVIVGGATYYDGTAPDELRFVGQGAAGGASDDRKVLHLLGHALENYLGHSVRGRRFDDGADFLAEGAGCDGGGGPSGAWLEGFAEYFAYAARLSLRNHDPGPLGPAFDKWDVRLQWLGDFDRASGADFRSFCPPAGELPGDNFPEYVKSTLFDLFDTTPELDAAGAPFDSIGDVGHDPADFGRLVFQIFDHELDTQRIGRVPILNDVRHAWVVDRGLPDPWNVFRNDPDQGDLGDDAVVADFNVSPAGSPFAVVAAAGLSVPSEVIVGSNFTVTMTFENVGQNVWTPGTYVLSSAVQDDQIWGTSNIGLESSDHPGGVPNAARVTFTFGLRAPCTPSTQIFAWQLRGPGGLFGPTLPLSQRLEVVAPTCGDHRCDATCGAETSATCPGDCHDAEWIGFEPLSQVPACETTCGNAPWLGEEVGCHSTCPADRAPRDLPCAHGDDGSLTCVACIGSTVHVTPQFRNAGTHQWFQSNAGILGIDDVLHTPHTYVPASPTPLYAYWSTRMPPLLASFAPDVIEPSGTFEFDDDLTYNVHYPALFPFGCLRYGVGIPNYAGGTFAPILFGDTSPPLCVVWFPCF